MHPSRHAPGLRVGDINHETSEGYSRLHHIIQIKKPCPQIRLQTLIFDKALDQLELDHMMLNPPLVSFRLQGDFPRCSKHFSFSPLFSCVACHQLLSSLSFSLSFVLFIICSLSLSPPNQLLQVPASSVQRAHFQLKRCSSSPLLPPRRESSDYCSCEMITQKSHKLHNGKCRCGFTSCLDKKIWNHSITELITVEVNGSGFPFICQLQIKENVKKKKVE